MRTASLSSQSSKVHRIICTWSARSERSRRSVNESHHYSEFFIDKMPTDGETGETVVANLQKYWQLGSIDHCVRLIALSALLRVTMDVCYILRSPRLICVAPRRRPSRWRMRLPSFIFISIRVGLKVLFCVMHADSIFIFLGFRMFSRIRQDTFDTNAKFRKPGG